MSDDERRVPLRLTPAPRRGRPEPFNVRPARASLGEAPDWRGSPPGRDTPPVADEARPADAEIGDKVKDHGTGRRAIVTDIRRGVPQLRPVMGGGDGWPADPDDLEVIERARPTT